MQVFATRWRFSSLFRHQMAFFKEKSQKIAKNRKKSQKNAKNREKCKFSPPGGAFFFFFFEKMQDFAALVHFFATRWRFLKKNRE